MAVPHICEPVEIPSPGPGDLYVATDPCSVLVGITNTNGAARTINLYVRKGAGTPRNFGPANYNLAAGGAWPPNAPYGPIALNIGDSIRGDASGAGVHAVVTGVGLT